VFDTYWKFAAERQAIYRRRLAGLPGPWTDDAILRTFRFTNAYRAADRTSQYLIRRVIYEGSPVHREQVFRILLFRLFNLPSTWEVLTKDAGPIDTASFDPARFAPVLEAHSARGNTLYSAAYVIPPVPQTGRQRKHEQHLELVQWMLDDSVDDRLANAASLQEVFGILTKYPSLGRFLAFQLAIDINYGPHLNFNEMDFVVAGPGASEGIRKCFVDRDGWSDEEIIRWVTDRQVSEFAERGLEFDDLWGRPLQLIDCQNLFCEIAKYSRVSHPEFTAEGGRHRIKRSFAPTIGIERPWFPPKWSINDQVWSSSEPLGQQLDLALEQVQLEPAAAADPNGAPNPVRLEDRLLPLGR
jgi:hypothetical protein